MNEAEVILFFNEEGEVIINKNIRVLSDKTTGPTSPLSCHTLANPKATPERNEDNKLFPVAHQKMVFRDGYCL